MPMKVVCFVNRLLGTRIAQDLLSRPGVEVVAVVTNDPPNVDLDRDLLPTEVPVMPWSDYLESFQTLPADRGVSALFRHRLPSEVLTALPVVNLHPSLLPWGRGAHPATWAIWEETSFGATAHLMIETIDSGPILAQRAIPVASSDTSATLFDKGLDALWDLYRVDVVAWLAGEPVAWREQPPGGSSHVTSDLEALSRLAASTVSPQDRERLERALSMGPATPRRGSWGAA
jgi:methionyl-tRNA formyltransferase